MIVLNLVAFITSQNIDKIPYSKLNVVYVSALTPADDDTHSSDEAEIDNPMLPMCLKLSVNPSFVCQIQIIE